MGVMKLEIAARIGHRADQSELQGSPPVGMDERIWSRLPEDMIERVLGFLPFSTCLRFRRVCRRWESIVSSRRFVEQTLQPSRPPPPFLCLTTLASTSPVVHVFNPESRKWTELSLTFLQPDLVDVYVIASDGGLLYLQARADDDNIYITCNPLTKSWRTLPPKVCDVNESDRIPLLASLSVCRSLTSEQESENSYEIIEAAGTDRLESYTRTYESRTGLWSRVGSTGPMPFQSGVIVNQCLYGATIWPPRLLKMELGKGATGCCESSAGFPAYAMNPNLVECCGYLAVVAGFSLLARDPDVNPQDLKIWRLDESSMSWEEVSVMPLSMQDRLNPACFDSLKCAGHGSQIFISNYDGRVVYVYDMADDSWNAFPECPSLADGQSFVEEMFFFNPSLRSVP